MFILYPKDIKRRCRQAIYKLLKPGPKEPLVVIPLKTFLDNRRKEEPKDENKKAS
jgi:RNase P protein component